MPHVRCQVGGRTLCEICEELGLEGRQHGLRKAGAVRLAEAGATEEELMALFGWTKAATAQIYTAKVNKLKLSKLGMAKLEAAMRKKAAREKAEHIKAEREKAERDLDKPQQPGA